MKDFKNENNAIFENRFIWTQEKLISELERNTTVNCSKSLVLSYKKQDYSEEVPPNLIDEKVGVSTTEEAGKDLDKLFGTRVFNYPKSESLLKYLIGMVTEQNDIVLDYHLGSGTTCAVAHKMGRRWIGIEQMDYIDNITKTRLIKVLEGEQGGISKAVNWQGGGSFVYFELKKYNQEFVEKILLANSKTELNKVYKEMQENAFLQFWFGKENFKEVFRDDDDNLLDLTERKNKLLEILDQNQLYLNCLDMNDSKHHISDAERALTQAFYGSDIIGDDKPQKQVQLDLE